MNNLKDNFDNSDRDLSSFLGSNNNNNDFNFDKDINLLMNSNDSDNINHFNDFDQFLNLPDLMNHNDRSNNNAVSERKEENLDEVTKPKRKYVRKNQKTSTSSKNDQEQSELDSDKLLGSNMPNIFDSSSNNVPVAIQSTSFKNELLPDFSNHTSSSNQENGFDDMLEILPDGLDILQSQSGIDLFTKNENNENKGFDSVNPMNIQGNVQNGEIANFWAFNVEDLLSSVPSSLGSTTISAANSANSQMLTNNKQNQINSLNIDSSVGGFGKPSMSELKKTKTNSSSISNSTIKRRGSTASNGMKSQTHSFASQNIKNNGLESKQDQRAAQQCYNCKTLKTPLWRRDSSGNTLCNACGLFHKLHGTMRPLSLKSDVIKKRNAKKKDSKNDINEGSKISKSRKSSVASTSNTEFTGIGSGGKKDMSKPNSNGNAILGSNNSVSNSINISNKSLLNRRESSSSSLTTLKARNGLKNSMSNSYNNNFMTGSLPGNNNGYGNTMRSRKSSFSSSVGSTNTPNKMSIPILPKKKSQQHNALNVTPNNSLPNGSNILMSSSHPNYNQPSMSGTNGATFMSTGSFVDNSPRFTQGSMVALSPFTNMPGTIDTSYSVVSTPSEMNTPLVSGSGLHRLSQTISANNNNGGSMGAGSNVSTSSNSFSGGGGALYNNNFIAQMPSTTISNNNIISMNGNTMSQYTMPQQRSSNNSNPVKVSLLSQGLKNKSLGHGTKINPHEVSSMYNSFYGDTAQGNSSSTLNPNTVRSVTNEYSEDVDMQDNEKKEKDDLSWLKFGM